MSHKFWRVLWLMVFLLAALIGGAGLSQAQPELPMGRSGPPGEARPSGTGTLTGSSMRVEDIPAEARAPQAPNAAWMFENFEGTWPGEYAVTKWNVQDASSDDGGDYLFGKRDCLPFRGSFAAWSVGGGANGSQLGCNGNYPNNLYSWAFYGPVTLTGASTARLNFYITGKSEWQAACNYDRLWVVVSTDNSFDLENDESWPLCEDYSSGYWQWQFILNNYVDQTIWIGFGMDSDSSNQAAGYTLDNVSLDDCRIPGAPTLVAPGNGSSTADSTPTFNWTAPAGATVYRLLVDNNNDFSSPVIDRNVSATQYTHGTALPAGTYYWATRAFNTTGGCDAFGNWSAVSSFTVTAAPTCYQLTLNKNGQGSVPTAEPSQSNGCAAGRYIAGATVNLSANPANGWRVGSWQGTNNNGSTANSNTVTMPAAAHTARVNYVANTPTGQQVTLPMVLFGAPYGYLGPSEDEDNDQSVDATGPLLLNRDYFGFPNDERDWYDFNLATTTTLFITLDNISGKDPQLTLYHEADFLVADTTAPYSLIHTTGPGHYYVRVLVAGNFNSTTQYKLRISTP